MVNKPFIIVREARFGYVQGTKQITVLTIDELELTSGNFYGLVGFNGTGKSTFIRSLCGLQPVLSGEILVDGKNIDLYDKTELAQLLAVVLTNRVGGFNLTVRDAVASARLPYTNWYNVLQDNDQKAIENAIAATGVGDLTNHYLNQLSDGMFQRTMVARALAQETTALLLDEPTAFLDYASKHRLLMFVSDLAKNQQKMILASSHDLDMLLKYSNQLLVCHSGIVETIETRAAGEHAGFQKLTGGFHSAS